MIPSAKQETIFKCTMGMTETEFGYHWGGC